MKKRINEAYAACLRLAHAGDRAYQHLEAAQEAGEREEKQHRKGEYRTRYRLSVADVGRYFAVRWFLDTDAAKAPKDWAEAAELRDDARLAYAAAATVMRRAVRPGYDPSAAFEVLRERFADVLAADYSEIV